MGGNGHNGRQLRGALQTAKSRTNGHSQAANFDWDEARQRITKALTELSNTEETPEIVATLLQRRTTQLARVVEEADQGEQINLILAVLGREVYGLEAQYVADMRPVDHITRVPRVPAWVAGVINWRGHVVSVIDLLRWWNLPKREAAEGAAATVPYLVVIETTDLTVALLVDDVLAVEALPWSSVQEVGGTVRGLRTEFVRGVISHNAEDKQLIIILDLPALLADPQLIIHEEIM